MTISIAITQHQHQRIERIASKQDR